MKPYFKSLQVVIFFTLLKSLALFIKVQSIKFSVYKYYNQHYSCIVGAPSNDPTADLAAYLDGLTQATRFQVEEPVKPFIGRENELSWIKYTLLDKKYAVITGVRGVGKSELIKKYISENPEGNILWINSTSLTQMTDDFKNLHKQALGDVGDKKLHIVVIDTLRHFKNSKSLFVFDGAESDNLFVEKLKAIVGESPSMGVIVTSRDEIWNTNDFSVQKLNGFSKADAVKYIKIALKDVDVPTDETKCEELAEILEYLPLALKHITGVIVKRNSEGKKYTIDDVIGELKGEPTTTTTQKPPRPPTDTEKDLLEKIQEESSKIGSKIATGAEKAWEKVQSGAGYVGGQISHGAQQAGKEISKAAEKAADSVKNFFSGFG